MKTLRLLKWGFLVCAIFIGGIAYGLTVDIDPDFEAEAELEMRNLQNQIHNNEDEIEALKLKDVSLEQHHHESTEQRMRYLESEAQKFETAIGIIKWLIGVLVAVLAVCVPVFSIKVFRHV